MHAGVGMLLQYNYGRTDGVSYDVSYDVSIGVADDVSVSDSDDWRTHGSM
jgi:hypothetical protein